MKNSQKTLKSWELIILITSLETSEKEDLEPIKYIDHTCRKTPCNNTSVKYVIKILRIYSVMPEEWIIFIGLD